MTFQQAASFFSSDSNRRGLRRLAFMICMFVTCFATGIVLLCDASYASAQSMEGLGALRGTITDNGGAIVPKAKVVVSNAKIGLKREIVASSDGDFEASSLPPEDGYVVTVTMPGFATYEATKIGVHVGQTATVEIKLTVSQVAETVTVDASEEVLDTTRSGVSELVGQQEINDLPINGRRVDQFVLLTPGVTTDGSGGEVTFRGVPGNNIFLQDGMDVTQQWGQDDAGGVGAFSPLSQDAVQEFQVQTSGYSAEFGHAAGGIVNTLTKSGTNSFHGSAFEFFKNRTLNSTDPYSTLNNAPFNPPNWRHQFGGSVGGPIKKDKLFFFANTEITRESRPLVSSTTQNSEVNSAGQFNNLTNLTTGCDTVATDPDHATAAQCAAAQAYIQKTFGVIARKLNENVGFAKLDYRPSEKDNISINFNLMQFASPNGAVSASALADGSGYYPNGNAIDLTRWARFSETHIVSPTALNEFRFGWFKDTRKDSVNPALVPSDGLVSGLSAGDLTNLGANVNIPNSQPSEDRFLFVDNFSKTIQKHQLKFGAETNYLRDVEDALFFAKGEYFFGTVTDWAQDLLPDASDPNAGHHYYGFLQSFGPLLTRAIVRDYNFYAQDQYQFNQKLTLNLGLRYEFNRFTQPPLNTEYPATGVLNEPLGNFAPRLGFAYSMNQGATVLRGGYGISYARLPSASVIRLQQRNGVIQKTIFFTPSTPGAPVFPGYDLATNLSGSGSNVTYADGNLKTPYTEQADLTVEQRVDKKTTLDISYLLNIGQDFLTRKDDNLVPSTQTYTYTLLDVNNNQTGTYTTPIYTATNDPAHGVLNHIYNGGKLYYNALAVSLARVQSKNTSFNLAYTWSHAIDLGLGAGADNIYYTDPPVSVLNGAPRTEKGRSPLDQRHRLVASGLISAPHIGYGSELLNQSLNGWQFSAIETYATPQGVDPYVEIGSLPIGSFTGVYGSTVSGDGIGFASYQRAGFAPRSSLALGTTIRTDVRLTKEFKLPKEESLTLNFEGFNLFNYSTITSVQQVAYNATTNPFNLPAAQAQNVIGYIKAVPGAGAGTASAGFPDGTNARRGQVSARFTF